MPDDESEVPSFSIDQSKRSKQNLSNQLNNHTNEQQQQQPQQQQQQPASSSTSIDCDEEFS